MGAKDRLRALGARIGWKLRLAIWAFAGLMMASAGTAMVPASVRLAAPIVCPSGTVESVVITRTTSTGKGGTSMTWNLVCIDREGGGKHIGAGHTFLILWPLWTLCFAAIGSLRRGITHLVRRRQAA